MRANDDGSITARSLWLSAAKAAGDQFVRAYMQTYRDMDVALTHCANNYGPFQFPEKLIPLMILNAVEAKPLPIYGDGGNVRDWLYVEDHCRALLLVLEKGRAGERYNVGGGSERTNLQVVERLCAALEELRPASANPALLAKGIRAYAELQRFVKDRPGHDRRYAIDATKIREELGWAPRFTFGTALPLTIRWYQTEKEWLQRVRSGAYREYYARQYGGRS